MQASPTSWLILYPTITWIWETKNCNHLKSTLQLLISSTLSCFKPRRCQQMERGLMWGHNHVLHSSPQFNDDWCRFFSHKAININRPTPAFTCLKFLRTIKSEISCMGKSVNAPITSQDNNVEENALRYVAKILPIESSYSPRNDYLSNGYEWR